MEDDQSGEDEERENSPPNTSRVNLIPEVNLSQVNFTALWDLEIPERSLLVFSDILQEIILM